MRTPRCWSPICWPTAPASSPLELRDLSADIDDLLAGQLWLQIRTFPWRRRTHAYAKSLLLDTRLAVRAELRPYRTRSGREPVVLVDPIRVPTSDVRVDEELLRFLLDRSLLETHDRHECELLDVLQWAGRRGVVDADDIAFVIDLVDAAARIAAAGAGRHRGVNDAAEIAAVAEQRGVCAKTIWRRRARVITALRQASGDYLAAVA